MTLRQLKKFLKEGFVCVVKINGNETFTHTEYLDSFYDRALDSKVISFEVDDNAVEIILE